MIKNKWNYITKKLNNFPIRTGVSVFDGVSQIYGYNYNKKFDTACSIMVYIMVEYVNQINLGMVNKEEYLIYNEENYATGAGIIKFLPYNSKININDCVELMIAASDHIAANLLIDKLGIDNINKTIISLGFYDTKLYKKFLIPKEKNIGISTPVDYAKFFCLLNNKKIISIEASEFMINILLKQKYKDILTEKIKTSNWASLFIDVASKSGKADGKMYDNTTNSYIVDGGVVYTKSFFYTISLFGDINYNQTISLNMTKSFLQEISRDVYELLQEVYNETDIHSAW